MRTLQRVLLARMGGLGLIAGLMVQLTIGSASAQRIAVDPVEELRQALKIAIRDPMKNPDELEFRKKDVGKKIDALRSIGDLRRALQLQAAWQDDNRDERVADIDKPLRARVAERFQQGLRDMMKNGKLGQLAAASLLEEVGVGIRGTGTDDKGGLTRALAPDLVVLLKSDIPQVQVAAARALGKINPDPSKAAPALGALLKSGADPRLRRAAAAGLSDMIQIATLIHKGRSVSGIVAEKEDVVKTTEAAVPAAGPGISDSDSQVRQHAIEAMQNAALAMAEITSDPKPRQEFPPAGRKWSDDERKEVADYRQVIEEERKDVSPIAIALRAQAPALRQTLQDSDPKVRLATCKALEEIGHAYHRLAQRAASVPVAPADQPNAAKEKEARSPHDRIPNRIRGQRADLHNDVLTNRLLVAWQKPQDGKNDDPLLDLLVMELPGLEAQLDDPNVRIRLTAMNAVEMLGAEAYRAAPMLLKAMNDPSRFVRWSAVRTLGKTRPLPEAVPVITRLLTSPDLGVRTAAAMTLENYGNAAKDTVHALADAALRGDAESRETAIRTLESLGTQLTQPAIPQLVEALGDRDARVRRAAAEALGKFGSTAVQAEPALSRALNDDDAEVRKAASEALLSIVRK